MVMMTAIHEQRRPMSLFLPLLRSRSRERLHESRRLACVYNIYKCTSQCGGTRQREPKKLTKRDETTGDERTNRKDNSRRTMKHTPELYFKYKPNFKIWLSADTPKTPNHRETNFKKQGNPHFENRFSTNSLKIPKHYAQTIANHYSPQYKNRFSANYKQSPKYSKPNFKNQCIPKFQKSVYPEISKISVSRKEILEPKQ